MPEELMKRLLNHELYDPKTLIDGAADPILEDNDLLASVAGLASSSLPALTALIRNRVMMITKHIIFRIPPDQLTQYRQALLELDQLLADLEKYEEEYRKRSAPKETATGETQAPESSGTVQTL